MEECRVIHCEHDSNGYTFFSPDLGLACYCMHLSILTSCPIDFFSDFLTPSKFASNTFGHLSLAQLISEKEKNSEREWETKKSRSKLKQEEKTVRVKADNSLLTLAKKKHTHLCPWIWSFPFCWHNVVVPMDHCFLVSDLDLHHKSSLVLVVRGLVERERGVI